ncbi:hypothetical protein D3C71_856960 [compost metagenome]
MGGVLQHSGIRCRQTIKTGFQSRHCVQPWMVGDVAFLPGFRHAVGSQPREAGTDVQLLKGFVFCPGFDLLEPGLEVTRLHLATVDTLARDTFVADGEQLVSPLPPRHLEFQQCDPSFLQTLGDQLGRFFAFNVVALAGKQSANARQQRRRATPIATHPIQRIALHRVTEQTPVVAQDFTEQIAVIGFQGLGKQAATVERVLAQHALAPTVNRRNGSFIHPLRGNVQSIGAAGPLLG